MKSRLTEANLQREIERHQAECEECDAGRCAEADRIEASFWDEVDRRIDEYRERER